VWWRRAVLPCLPGFVLFLSNPISPTATSFRPSHRFGRLHHQLRPMAKRRLNPDEIRAAVEAGPPPHSVNYETDKKWHAEQNRWLAKWTERRLPRQRRQREQPAGPVARSKAAACTAAAGGGEGAICLPEAPAQGRSNTCLDT